MRFADKYTENKKLRRTIKASEEMMEKTEKILKKVDKFEKKAERKFLQDIRNIKPILINLPTKL